MRQPHGRAIIDPENPEPTAECDKCGFLWNHNRLAWQFDWMGDKLQNKRILVCPDCMDQHAMFLKTIHIPPDPPPVYNTRPGRSTAIDGVSDWTLLPPPGLNMFPAKASMGAVLTAVNLPNSISMSAVGQYLSFKAGIMTPNNQIFSVSMWFKASDVVHAPSMFRCDTDNIGPNLFRIVQSFDTDIDITDFTDGISTDNAWNDGASGTPGFVPLSTWTHILFSVDTTQSIESNRIKIYKDGSLVPTYFSKPCNQGSVFTNFMRTGTTVVLGANSLLTPYRGKLAFFQVIDGTQVSPTDVGQSVAGTWKHKPYSGSYGSTGFYFSGDNGLNTKSGVGQPYTFSNGGASFDYTDVPPYVSY